MWCCQYSIDLPEPVAFRRVVQKRCANGVFGELRNVFARQIQRLRHSLIVRRDVAAEIGRVIGIHRDANARIEQALQIVIFHALHDFQLHIRERTDGERHLLAHEPGQQRGVLLAAHAMVHAADFQHIQSLINVLRRAFFARVRNGQKAFLTGALEHLSEFRRRVSDLG